MYYRSKMINFSTSTMSDISKILRKIYKSAKVLKSFTLQKFPTIICFDGILYMHNFLDKNFVKPTYSLKIKWITQLLYLTKKKTQKIVQLAIGCFKWFDEIFWVMRGIIMVLATPQYHFFPYRHYARKIWHTKKSFAAFYKKPWLTSALTWFFSFVSATTM